ncbi:MAG TPA: nodulation protein NfeD [Actinomycetota bacterium]|nr:nodulation protein NfeD [Actinomycetota bacterium]
MQPRTRSRRLRLALPIVVAVAGAALLAAPAGAQERSSTVDLIEVSGVIDPAVADYLTARLESASEDGVHAAVIRLDTPGGLDVSMRRIIQHVLASRVPIAVWVEPRGARAASAGTFIAYAAHLLYMAEATTIGAATPVNLAGDTSPELQRKVTNDAAEYIREIALERGRDPEWAERAVREGASLGASEAVELGVADGVASSLRELLEAMDGATVETAAGPATLETWDEARGTPSAALRFQDMNVFQKLLHAVANPEVAFLLLLAGAFGLIFEIYNPGIGLAGVLGAVSLVLGFYALSVLPTNWAGVALVAASVAFFVVDLQVAGLGVWTVGGIAALVAGGALLFSGADPAVELSPWAIAAAVAGALLFFVSVMTAALRVRLRRPITGEEAIVGLVGEAKTDIAPEGTVVTKGTLWRARTMETGIAAGSKVKVMATEGLVLLVEPVHEGEHAGRAT